MAKNSVRDYSATASLNTDVQSVDIDEGCAPSGINNAIREVMADIKDVSTGTIALESPAADSLTVTGDLTVDTSTLKVDSTNNRVGIGTTSPDSTVTVNGSSKVYSTNTGNSITHSVTATSTYAQTITLDDVGLSFDNNSALRGYRFSNNGSERMRIDSSGNVLIGTNTAVRTLTVNKSGSSAIAHFESDQTSSKVYFHDTNTTNTYSVAIGSVGDAMALYSGSGGAERMRILSGGGLTFNGDTAAANALDDYEEGTWTPANGGSSSRTGTWDSTLTGTYTKIGRMVMVTLQISGTSMSFSASGGYSYYTGLPFAVAGAVGASWASSAISGAGAGTVYVDTAERVWIYAPVNTTFSANTIYTSFVYYTT